MKGSTSTTQNAHRRIWLAGLIALLTIASLLVWAGSRETAAELEIKRVLAELRAAGEPLNAADMARLFPNPPPQEDAMLMFSNVFIFASAHRPPGLTPFIMGGTTPARTEPLGEPIAGQLKIYYDETKTVFEPLPARWPAGVRFALHWEHGMAGNTVAPFVQVRSLQQMVGALALHAAESGDAPRTTELLERSFHIGQMIPSDLLVSHMIKKACAGLACATAERCLNRVTLNEEQLQALAASLPPADTNGFAIALHGEHCLAIWAFQEIRAGRSLDDFYGSPRLPWWKAMVRKLVPRRGQYSDEDFLRYLALYHPSVEMTALPPLQAIAQSSNIMVQYQTNVTTGLAQGVPAHWTKALRAHFECEARLTALRTALAAERFRLAHDGKPPQSLAELVPVYLPAVPRDLFDNQPLRFQTLSPGYVIYSSGADGVDDGGLEKTSATTNYDVTVTVER